MKRSVLLVGVLVGLLGLSAGMVAAESMTFDFGTGYAPQGTTYEDPTFGDPTLFNQGYVPNGTAAQQGEQYWWNNQQQSQWANSPVDAWFQNGTSTITNQNGTQNQPYAPYINNQGVQIPADDYWYADLFQNQGANQQQVYQQGTTQQNPFGTNGQFLDGNIYGACQSPSLTYDQQQFTNMGSGLPPLEAYWGLTPEGQQAINLQVQRYRESVNQQLTYQQQQMNRQKQDDQLALQRAQQDQTQQMQYQTEDLNRQMADQQRALTDQRNRMAQDFNYKMQQVQQQLAANPNYPPEERERILAQLREQQLQQEQQLKDYELQLREQQAAQQSNLVIQRAQMDAQREAQAGQLKLRDIEWQKQMELARLALSGPPVGGQISAPQFPNRWVTDAERKFIQDWMNFWMQQRRVEEQRAQIEKRFQFQKAQVELEIQVAQRRRQLQIAQITAQEKFNSEKRKLDAERQRTMQQLETQKRVAMERRRVEDMQWQRFLQEINRSRGAVDLRQYYEWRRQLEMYRQQQDQYFVQAAQYADRKYQDDSRNLQRTQEQTTISLKRQEEGLNREIQDRTTALQRSSQDADQQLARWIDSRKLEERSVQDNFNNWTKFQAQCAQQYQQYRK